MELFKPYKNEKQKKLLFIITAISFLSYFPLNFAYNYNLFNTNNVIYIKGIKTNYTLSMLFYNISNAPFVLMFSWISGKSGSEFVWFKFIVSLVIDCAILTLFFDLTTNPYENNLNRSLWYLISLIVYIFKSLFFILQPYTLKKSLTNKK